MVVVIEDVVIDLLASALQQNYVRMSRRVRLGSLTNRRGPVV
jgi:hypothetical protein